jgi:hypothetical protein
MENSPFSKADFITGGSSSISSIYTGIHLEDMGTEKNMITDSNGSGGIIGITNQKSALVRWTLTRHFLTSFSRIGQHFL